MTTRRRFWFVAGEQAMSVESLSVLDAWLAIENKSRSQPIASEYRTLPIEAYDEAGTLIAKRNWQGWHEAVLRDTYGDSWREHCEHAAKLV